MRPIKRTLSIIEESFPDSIVEGFEYLEKSLVLPDPGDRHVLAAAIHSESQYIVTNNLKDFPSHYLQKFDIQPISSDDFLSKTITNYPDKAKYAFIKMVNRFKMEPKTPGNVIEQLKRHNLSQTAVLLQSIL